MSKKALVIGMEAELCTWIYEQLAGKRNDNEALQELLEGLKGLKEMEYGSLILSRDEQDTLHEGMEEKIQSGALMIDKVNRSVSYGQDLIQLTPKEFDILCLLASNKGKIYSKEQIYSNVWKEAYTYDDSNIMAHIRKLRKKIEPDP
ncbi:MAG: winged helix-turn-helix domain-containing protein, partial [Niameybacter sp.]